MSKILWIINKYVGRDKSEEFYPHFLLHTQKELNKRGHELSFVFFSELLSNNEIINNKYVFSNDKFAYLTKEGTDIQALRIERDYDFTFKQAYFSDIIQVFKGKTDRNITVPEKYFQDLSFLVPRFLFLEELITSHDFDVIFSDVSPEVEMEFGRVIGNKLNKIVLKSSEGSALGKTVLFRSFDFGKDQLVEPNLNEYTNEEAEVFCKDFIENEKLPYIRQEKNIYHESFLRRIIERINRKDYIYLIVWPLTAIWRKLILIFYFIERTIFKPLVYDKFDPNIPYLFTGFHLNQESTMVLRSQPYTNQTVLVEMISRTLPYNHVLYVRSHPHWPDTFSYKYLKKIKEFPNVRLISDRISIHQIIKNSKGIITYNATTGIEALVYGKPVLSFASNIYIGHPAVDYCNDLFELGSKLSKLINTTVDNKETISFISKINSVSIDFELGSSFFLSELDSKEKASVFARFINKSIVWCLDNKN